MFFCASGVMASISAFQAGDPGSIPGWRIFIKQIRLFEFDFLMDYVHYLVYQLHIRNLDL